MTTTTPPRRGRGRPPGGEATTRATRESIVDAAYKVFSESGYEGASMREVARRCGVSHATLIHHFPRKDDLLTAVLTKRDEGFELDLDNMPPVDEFFADLVGGARHNQEVSGLINMFTMLAAEANEPSHPAHAYFTARLATITTYITTAIELAQAEGRFHDQRDPQRIALSIVSLWDGLQLNAPHSPELSIPDLLQDYLEQVLGKPIIPT